MLFLSDVGRETKIRTDPNVQILLPCRNREIERNYLLRLCRQARQGLFPVLQAAELEGRIPRPEPPRPGTALADDPDGDRSLREALAHVLPRGLGAVSSSVFDR